MVGGLKEGTMTVISSGQGRMNQPNYILNSQSPDSNGVMWYEIEVGVTSLQNFIESQPDELWAESTQMWGKFAGIPYIVHESLYTFITLRWQ